MPVLHLNRRSTLTGLVAALLAPLPSLAAARWPQVAVHKDPNCGCCGGWAEHLRAAGFPVRIVDSNDLAAVRRRLGVPEELAGCHSAQVGDYVVEGHVPEAAIKRLLSEKPSATGIAVPGMPLGSPGMDGPPEIYEVMLFGPQSRSSYGKFRGAHPV